MKKEETKAIEKIVKFELINSKSHEKIEVITKNTQIIRNEL